MKDVALLRNGHAITIQVPHEDYAALTAVAKANNTTPTAIVRGLVEDYLSAPRVMGRDGRGTACGSPGSGSRATDV